MVHSCSSLLSLLPSSSHKLVKFKSVLSDVSVANPAFPRTNVCMHVGGRSEAAGGSWPSLISRSSLECACQKDQASVPEGSLPTARVPGGSVGTAGVQGFLATL